MSFMMVAGSSTRGSLKSSCVAIFLFDRSGLVKEIRVFRGFIPSSSEGIIVVSGIFMFIRASSGL